MSEEHEIAAKLRPHEAAAIHFLYAEVEHEMGAIEDENALAAAICFCDLAKQGLIASPAFPLTKLTPLGLRVRNILAEELTQ